MDKKSQKNIGFIVASLIVFILVGAISAVVIYQKVNIRKSKAGNSVAKEASIDGNEYKIPSEIDSIEDIANKLSPSVVSIKTLKRGGGLFSFSSASAGTGIIVSEDGYILTNKHVVSGEGEVSVTLGNGDVYEDIDIVAVDPLNDVAFLKIENGGKFIPAEIGDSKTIKIGQQVVAIGNALGQYQNTVTSGIVSGVNRSITATDGSRSENLTDMIQTDAAINSGNSGGPLVNAKGQVIGINTAVANDAQGIGFAIPIVAVKGMMKSLIEKGRAERAVLGVNYIQITPEITKEYNLPVKFGAYLKTEDGSAIRSGSAAEKSGIKDGDIITHINGNQVGISGGVSSLIGEFQAGEKITLSLIREGKKLEISVVLGSATI